MSLRKQRHKQKRRAKQGIGEGQRKSDDSGTDWRQSWRNTVPMVGEESYWPGRRGSLAHATRRREGDAGHDIFLEGTVGDTQRSQTISAENQGIAEQTVCDAEKVSDDLANGEGPPVLIGENSFGKLRMPAKKNPDMVFTSLIHRIDLSLLRDSFRLVRKSESAGADGVTAKEYAGNPDANLCDLWERLRRGQYVATPAKRIWLEKEDGSKRPIGIPTPEDKIVQKAAETILYVIYSDSL